MNGYLLFLLVIYVYMANLNAMCYILTTLCDERVGEGIGENRFRNIDRIIIILATLASG